MALDRDIHPWPRESTQHEFRSIRKALAEYSLAPPEMRLAEIEGAFGRPMIQFTLLSQRVENRSQFDFQVIKDLSLTYFGSEHMSPEDRHAEGLAVADWLTEFFGRGSYHGPIIPIYDFSGQVPTRTEDWIEIDSASADLRKDNYGLWTVPVDIRYGVSRDEVNYGDGDTSVPITDVQFKVEIG